MFSALNKIAVASISFSGIVAGGGYGLFSYLNKKDLITNFEEVGSSSNITDPETGDRFKNLENTSKVIAEIIQFWNREGGEELTCEILESKSSLGNFLDDNKCKELFREIWQERDKQHPKTLIRVSEKYVWDILNIQFSLNNYKELEKTIDSLKRGVHTERMICKSDGQAEKGKIVLVCDNKSF
ncbi:hypothetical protein MSUIS_01160 [Mycoplasma suis KI3806]|uniref:Uncharacterized protein n=2 Tax=Mycoplasma suis TaxID=57372 RepID=F0V2Y7_MYCS3|nr:hypothetical protein MSUIS_01160 [Mycoplasma suis KI3806]